MKRQFYQVEFQYTGSVDIFVSTALLTAKEAKHVKKFLDGLARCGHVDYATIYPYRVCRQHYNGLRNEITDALMLSDEEIAEAEKEGK